MRDQASVQPIDQPLPPRLSFGERRDALLRELGWRPHALLERSSWRPASKDVYLWLFCLAVSIVSIISSLDPPVNPGWPRGAALGLISLVPVMAILWRERLGDWLLLLGLADGLVTAMLGIENPDLAIIVGLYTIGTRRTRRQSFAAWALTIVQIAIVSCIRVPPVSIQHVLEVVARVSVSGPLFIIPLALGLYLGARRALVRTLTERAEDLERERELLARQAVAEERARIARELHDVVAHHVSVMVIQAGAAEASLPPEAASSAQALAAIRETGREALGEMRRMLGLLRSEAAGAGAIDESGTTARARPGDAGVTRTPQPGVEDLPALVGRVREAGIRVTFEIEGVARHLPPGIDLSAFRVAQEALTNTARHAGPGTHASVRLAYRPDSLVLEILDDGRGSPAAGMGRSPGRGHGLVGMRERVTLFGGTLDAGRRAGGGFRVHAQFPLDEDMPGGPEA